MTPDEKRLALRVLAGRMNRSHCWIKGADGPRQVNIRFTEVQLSEHCAGTRIYGLCPIAPGSKLTRVACLDLDSHKGETPFERMEAIAFEIGGHLEVRGHKPHIFSSSGGAGIHIYLTWAEDQDAYSVREMFKEVLAACGYVSGTKGVAQNQIEIFPKQDEVPADGKGSMFILPWSGKSAPVGDFNGWSNSAPVPLHEREIRSVPGAAPIAEHATLKSALDAIPNGRDGPESELSYDEWRNIVFAIHFATKGEAVGLSLAHEISSRSSKYDPEFLDTRVWPYIRSDRDGATITERSIFSKASELGWQDPTLADDFDVIVATDPAPGAPGQSPDKPNRFNIVHASKFAVSAKLRWFVKGVLPAAVLAMVFGESQSGKSFWTLDLLLAIARGLDWQGRKTIQSRCMYVAAEGSHGFRNRLNAYAVENAIKLEDIDLHILADQPNFLDSKHVRDLIIAIREVGGVKVVVIDTLAQVMPGGDENSSTDMGRAIMHCQMIYKHTGAMVVLIHHSGKDSTRGARGWSGMRGAIDMEAEIVRSNADRVATITKQKDGIDGTEFGFRLRVVPLGADEDGETITSCVVDHGAAVAMRQKRVVVGKNEREAVAVWQTLADAVEDGLVLTSEWLKAVEEAMARTHIGTREINKATTAATQGALDKGLLELNGLYVQKVA